jgi:hypothetical protein
MEKKSKKSLLKLYCRFVYEKGSLGSGKGKFIDEKVLQKEKERGFEKRQLTDSDCGPAFTDSGIIDSKEFVRRTWDRLKGGNDFREKIPLPVAGIKGMYSLKRLNECI